jgi:hypothetical protein
MPLNEGGREVSQEKHLSYFSTKGITFERNYSLVFSYVAVAMASRHETGSVFKGLAD